LAGLLAGKVSRSGVAGYVAGFPVPEVLQGINAFTLGMRAANPKASVKVVWLDTWFDPAREREAANALVNQGADILTNHSARRRWRRRPRAPRRPVARQATCAGSRRRATDRDHARWAALLRRSHGG
jgi:hypothetical protein